MTNFINANGFLTPKNPSNDLPNSEQVEFCKNILAFVKQQPKFNRNNSSYGYKHLIEYNYEKGYISNGAFLLAAQQLGFDIEQFELNGCLKFKSDDLKFAIIHYYANKIVINDDHFNKISKIIKGSTVKSFGLSIYDFYQFLNRKYVNINTTPFELFLILNQLDVKIKYQSSLVLSQVHNDPISWSRSFYIPISMSKLNKLFKDYI